MGTHQLPWQHTTPLLTASTTRIPTALFVTQLVMGLMAVPCGIVLIVNGMWMPKEALNHSPFESFLVPGILLGGVVGGSLLFSAWRVWVHHTHAPAASLVAGGVLLGWISIESVMVRDGRPLQAIVFVTSLVIIGLTWRLHRRGISRIAHRQTCVSRRIASRKDPS